MFSKETNAIREMFEELSLGAPENAVGFVMWRIMARYQRQVDRALAINNLTNLQFVTLALVAWFGRENEVLTQIELAGLAGIHPMQISQTLKAIEAKRMVSRRTSQADSRAKRVAITKQGLSTLRDALPKVIAVQSRVFGDSGRPGGALLTQLLKVDSYLPKEGIDGESAEHVSDR